MNLIAMYYLNWNGSKWLAEISENIFYHYANGDKNRGHSDTRIDYIAPGGIERSATIQDGQFHDYPRNYPLNVTVSDSLTYLDWSGTTRIVTLQSDGNPVEPPPPVPTLEMYYRNWNSSKWLAEIKKNVFYHYEDGDKNRCHSDIRVDYIAPGGIDRRATIQDGLFYDYPINIPSNVVVSDTLTYVDWSGATQRITLKP